MTRTLPDRYLGRSARRREGVQYWERPGVRGLVVWRYDVVDYWLTSQGTIAVPAGTMARPVEPIARDRAQA